MEEWIDFFYLYKEMIDYKNIFFIYFILENNRNILMWVYIFMNYYKKYFIF